MNIPDLLLSPEAAVGGIVGLAWAGLRLRKKYAADTRQIEADRVEVRFYQQLADQLGATRERLDEVSAERNRLATQVGELTGKVALLERENNHLAARMRALEARLGVRIDTQPGEL